jgi:hypothetical protein
MAGAAAAARTVKVLRYVNTADFSIGSNVMFEVKSTFTMTRHWSRNIAKFMACVYLGYEMHVIVWDQKSRKGEQLKAYVVFKRLEDFVDNVLYLAQACKV